MIPLQLKDMFFCRVREAEKKPFEQGWQNIFYTYEQIREFLPQENYGVLTGINGFGALDDDTPDKELLALYDKHFPETMQVRGHYYLKLKGWDGKKIIFYDSNNNHLGELQGLGQQVVGAGSLHPSGETYKIIKDIPIITIDYDDFMKVFDPYVRKEIKILYEYQDKSFDGEDINQIPLTNVLTGFNGIRRGDEIQGSNVWHGSETGMNFSINTSQNVWHCFRCDCGGGVAQAIALNERIINNCADRLTTDQFMDVLEIAQEKYGLKKSESKNPKGWALSISITRMANRYNLINCPKCNTPFIFNESYGLYYCDNCSSGGDLRRFASMCEVKQ